MGHILVSVLVRCIPTFLFSFGSLVRLSMISVTALVMDRAENRFVELEDPGKGILVYEIRGHWAVFGWCSEGHAFLEKEGGIWSSSPLSKQSRFSKISESEK